MMLKEGSLITLAYNVVPCPPEQQYQPGTEIHIRSHGRVVALGQVISTNSKRAKIRILKRLEPHLAV